MIDLRRDGPQLFAVTDDAPDGVRVPIGACSQALCACGEVKLTFTEGGAPVEAHLDPFSLGVSPNVPGGHGASSARLARELTPSSWVVLQRIVVDAKHDDLEKNVDQGRGEASFDELSIEKRGALVSHLDLFRYEPALTATVDDEAMYVDDAYCVRPSCPCTNVALRLVPWKVPESVAHPRFELLYDYVSGEARAHPDRPATPEAIAGAMAALHASNPSLLGSLTKRHKRLQALYARSRKGTAWNQKSLQLGRNDPCPCGSGQKYKKCCGA